MILTSNIFLGIPTQVQEPELNADKAVTNENDACEEEEEEEDKYDFINRETPWKCLDGKVGPLFP